MIGVLWAAALLLGVAGLGKLRHPRPTARAVVAAELPGASLLSALPVVRLVGAAEVVIAASVLLGGGTLPAAMLAIAFVLLSVIAARMLRFAKGQDCGCFGTSSEPISAVHVVINAAGGLLGAGAVLLPAAFSGMPSVSQALSDDAVQAALLIAMAAVLCSLCYLGMTALPALLALRAKVTAAR